MPAKARAVDLKPAVGRRLRAARSILYPSSDACAEAFGIPVNTWRNYEKGKRYPDPWHLNRFCDETGFTSDFIYRGRMRGIREDVQIRLAAAYPALVNEAPDVESSPARAAPRRDDPPTDELVQRKAQAPPPRPRLGGGAAKSAGDRDCDRVVAWLRVPA